MRYSQAHLTRAVVKGVAFGPRDYSQLVRAVGAAGIQCAFSGGGAGGGLWTQTIADLPGTQLVTVNTPDGAA